jgi:hypothetical protein
LEGPPSFSHEGEIRSSYGRCGAIREPKRGFDVTVDLIEGAAPPSYV